MSALATSTACVLEESSPKTRPLAFAPATRRLDVGTLHYGDNLDVLRRDIPNESVDLVYLDPPFNSDENYNLIHRTPTGEKARAQIQAFSDTWEWGEESEEAYRWLIESAPQRVGDLAKAFVAVLPKETPLLAYLMMMMPRLVELHRVLRRTGSLYLHCDPTASHYLKLALDAVFGATSFAADITWKRSGPHNDAKRWSPIADTILFYHSGQTFTWNPVHVPHDEDGSGKYTLLDRSGRRYQLTSLLSPKPRPNMMYEWKGHASPPMGWRFSRETMAKLDAEGRIWYPDSKQKRPRYKRYLDEMPGAVMGNVWTDIAPVNARADERLGYPTQKPVALLERILAASSNEGDVVLDPFCGCGTTIEAAERLKRKWIGIDITYIAIDLIQKRMRSVFGSNLGTLDVRGIPADIESARALFARNPFDFERWAVSMVDGQPNEKQVGDRGLDGVIRFPFDKDEAGRAVVSVKGGHQINPAMVRDLVGTVASANAAMGVLIVMDAATRGMLEAAKAAGLCRVPMLERAFPKIQILTVGELLEGKRPAMPTPFLPYIKAKYKPSAQMPLL